jgi:ubiquinone/menaquinone biosynthesis C-methylase UbiE
MTVSDNRTYYDAFAERYDRGRDRGYHRLIDDQAAALVERVGRDADVLEVGCGTGLVLERVARFARRAEGVDLSPEMLAHARARGLEVREGDCTALPFDDDRFDVVYSFKVLAHVARVEAAIEEMLRVVRPGGHVVFDAYNRRSLRWLVKRVTGARATSSSFDEAAIGTRWSSPAEALALVPAGARLIDVAGIRVTVAHPAVLRLPIVGRATEAIEWALLRSPAWRVAGFVVLTVRKESL